MIYKDKALYKNSLNKVDVMKPLSSYDSDIVAAHSINKNNLIKLEIYLKNEKEEKIKKLAQKLFLINIFLNSNVKKLLTENENLKFQLNNKKKNLSYIPDLTKILFKKKRKRKLKNEVDRNFKCPIPICSKDYGSENSLNQHIKLKHKKFWLHMKNHKLY